MKISNQLLEPLLNRIAAEYLELEDLVSGEFSEEAAGLRSFIDKKSRQIETVRVSLAYLQQSGFHDIEGEPDLRDVLRQLKLELRFTRRRWKRYLVNRERIRRNQERRTHVPTFAA